MDSATWVQILNEEVFVLKFDEEKCEFNYSFSSYG